MGFFSVNMFNRRKLMVDNDASYIMHSEAALKKAGIPCEIHTKRLRSTIGVRIDVGSYMSLNQAFTGNPQGYLYTYTICVPRKRLQDARRILGI